MPVSFVADGSRGVVDMVGVAQLVRASDCGSEGRGFESHYPPHMTKAEEPELRSGSLLFVSALGV